MKRGKILLLILAFIVAIGLGIFIWQSTEGDDPDGNQDNVEQENQDQNDDSREFEEDYETSVEIVVDGLEKPWDIKQASNGDIYFTQRQSGLYKYDSTVSEIYLPDDLFNTGEGGMLGFDLSPNFDENREIYACFNSQTSALSSKVVVTRLTLNEDFTEVQDREDIITDIPSSLSGRHSGCRVRFDRNEDDVIWVTTGDAADAGNPQDPDSLGGKVLRVNRDGEGVEGNMDEPFDPRIFSYGHRNIQGITLFEEYDEEFGYGFTSEHGPNVDDEINPLVKGNFGWDPNFPYIESVPMTDLDKYPDAVEALWSSGGRTIAMCGIEYIEQGRLQGDILLAALKDSYILRFSVTPDGNLERVEQIVNDYGRIRQVYQAPNGRIFFSTDNGNDDVIAEIVFN